MVWQFLATFASACLFIFGFWITCISCLSFNGGTGFSVQSVLTALVPGDEEEKVEEVSEGEQQHQQQPGEAEKEEEASNQQQKEVGESQGDSQVEPKEDEESQPNPAQPEETSIPKGIDDNSKIQKWKATVP